MIFKILRNYYTKQTKMLTNLLERYEACMVLHAVGDAMGYRNDQWESNNSTHEIHKQVQELGGVEAIQLEQVNWPVSDDTILHLANAECLCDHSNQEPKQFFKSLIGYYKRALEIEDHKKRAFGYTVKTSVMQLLSELNEEGYKIPFTPKGYACGASMRSSCIGLRYPKESQLNDLLEYSIVTSKMTHHHPTGYLGGFVAALFTSYAIQDKPIHTWGSEMIKLLPHVKHYIEDEGVYLKENLEAWPQFENAWNDYLKLRQIQSGQIEPMFPDIYDIDARDEFYKKYALNSRFGSAGHDSVIIAYDALLGCQNNWKELCYRAVLHGGDNDSTGAIAASWYGALNGFENVPKCNYETIEYKDRLLHCGRKLYQIAFN